MSLLSSPIIFTDQPAFMPAWTANPVDDVPTAKQAWLPDETLPAQHKTETQPVAESPQALSSHLGGSFSDIFYHRIHINPPELALGNLLSSQNRTVEVWNAFLTTVTITDLVASNNDGIALTQNPTPSLPFVADPLEAVYYEFSVSDTGPASIDAAYQWTIDGIDYVLAITGSRVVVWPFRPNWNKPYDETLSWLTDVMVAIKGNEQRFGLRDRPRRRFNYVSLVTDEQAVLLEAMLFGWQNRLFGLPIWCDVVITDQQQDAGTLSLSVDPEHYSFADNGLAIFMVDEYTYETVEIETVTPGGNITLLRPLQNTWPAGSELYPLNLAHLPTSVARTRHTDSTWEVYQTWDCDPLKTDPYLPAITTTQYLGLSVILEQPNWISPLREPSEFDYDVSDPGTGVIYYDETHDYPNLNRDYSWLLAGRLELSTFRGLLGILNGRQVPAWIPSWGYDVRITANIGASDQVFSAKDNGYLRYVNLHPARKHLFFLLNDGTYLMREITSVEDVGGGVLEFGLDTSLGQLVTPDDIERISYLDRCRLKSDSVTESWASTAVATVQTPFVLVPE